MITLSTLSIVSFAIAKTQAFTPLLGRKRQTTTGSVAPLLASVVLVDVDEDADRDLETLEEWTAVMGIQKADGVGLNSDHSDEIGLMTRVDLAAESPVLFVPENIILSASKAYQEIGPLENAESYLESAKAVDDIPQFYLFVKVLWEYEQGDNSAFYPWFNAMPRFFSNGASMTPFCFDCLPPLAGYLAYLERTRFTQFFYAIKEHVPFLSDATKQNEDLAKWAFAVVFTRGFFDDDNGDFKILPYADYFNHGTETEVFITHDEEGNGYAYTTCNVEAGSPLRISYGDPTNPSLLLARYGFLDESSPATFCKYLVLNPTQELIDMGYDHSRLLFYKDTGDVSEEVWDIILFHKVLEDDPDTQQALHQAHTTGDMETKQAIHEYYFPQTLAALQDHVDKFLQQLDTLSKKGDGMDLWQHPRLPLILAHNAFVKETFLKVKAKLNEYSAAYA